MVERQIGRERKREVYYVDGEKERERTKEVRDVQVERIRQKGEGGGYEGGRIVRDGGKKIGSKEGWEMEGEIWEKGKGK